MIMVAGTSGHCDGCAYHDAQSIPCSSNAMSFSAEHCTCSESQVIRLVCGCFILAHLVSILAVCQTLPKTVWTM